MLTCCAPMLQAALKECGAKKFFYNMGEDDAGKIASGSNGVVIIDQHLSMEEFSEHLLLAYKKALPSFAFEAEPSFAGEAHLELKSTVKKEVLVSLGLTPDAVAAALGVVPAGLVSPARSMASPSTPASARKRAASDTPASQEVAADIGAVIASAIKEALAPMQLLMAEQSLVLRRLEEARKRAGPALVEPHAGEPEAEHPPAKRACVSRA